MEKNYLRISYKKHEMSSQIPVWTILAVWDWTVDLEITVVVLANMAMKNAYI